MSRFEDTLWETVIETHGDTLTGVARPPLPTARPSRPRLVLGAGAATGAAALAVAMTLVLSATSSPPAYAVTREHDGSVLVEIHRAAGIGPANRRLAAMGVHAYLIPLAADQRGLACAAGRPAVIARANLAPVHTSPQVQLLKPVTATAPGTATVLLAPTTVPISPTSTRGRGHLLQPQSALQHRRPLITRLQPRVQPVSPTVTAPIARPVVRPIRRRTAPLRVAVCPVAPARR